ncbi:MAG TPA: DUF711 family protein [Candidatus Thermoplasmatota archaeon]|nr:DUF711 family protein [Candidatus Thermoplasmatota archaeon]
MKIRTITAGCNLKKPLQSSDKSLVLQIAKEAQKIKQVFKQKGYTVQTIRLSTQPWEAYATSKNELDSICDFLQSLCPEKFDYFNIGPISTKKNLDLLPSILQQFPQAFTTVNLCENNTIQESLTFETANIIKKIAKIESQGFANLRFACLCNINPNTPFYPASFHQGEPSFGIGCENSDLVASAFSTVGSFDEAVNTLKEKLTIEYQRIEQIAVEASEDTLLSYHGIDGSISPSVKPNESLIYGIEQLPFVSQFGNPGTLTAARLITSVLQQIQIKQCGYTGLMLPVMEDSGLAKRNQQGNISLTKLLSYSSVCGTGLDTIPLPGDISVETLHGILLDVISLSIKLDKPLSARLMPVPGKKSGDITEFDFDYFENTTVMNPR